RNLTISKGRPPSPGLFWRNSTGEPSFREICHATMPITGASSTKAAAETVISSRRLTIPILFSSIDARDTHLAQHHCVDLVHVVFRFRNLARLGPHACGQHRFVQESLHGPGQGVG